MLIERTRNPGQEARRNKHRGQYERDTNQCATDLVHRLDGGIARRLSLLDLGFNRFDDDDRVVDDQSHRQHEPQQRERVDRESDCGKEHESADQRHRNRQDRNQCCAPILQEDENNEHHEADRLEQRLDDLESALRHRDSSVERQRYAHVLRKFFGQFRHLRLCAIRSFERVRAGVLEQKQQRSRGTVHVCLLRVALCAELDP